MVGRGVELYKVQCRVTGLSLHARVVHIDARVIHRAIHPLRVYDRVRIVIARCKCKQ